MAKAKRSLTEKPDKFDKFFYSVFSRGFDNVLYPKSWNKEKERKELIERERNLRTVEAK